MNERAELISLAAVTSKSCISRIAASVVRMEGSSSTKSSRVLPIVSPCRFCTACARLHYTRNELAVHRDLDDLLLDRVRHQLCLVMDVQFAHQVEFVRFHGLDAQAKDHRDLFHRIPLGQKL